MTSGGNNFNHFSEIVPTREITTETEKTFLVFSSVAVGLFLEWAKCCSINSTHLIPTLQTCGHRLSWINLATYGKRAFAYAGRGAGENALADTQKR